MRLSAVSLGRGSEEDGKGIFKIRGVEMNVLRSCFMLKFEEFEVVVRDRLDSFELEPMQRLPYLEFIRKTLFSS